MNQIIRDKKIHVVVHDLEVKQVLWRLQMATFTMANSKTASSMKWKLVSCTLGYWQNGYHGNDGMIFKWAKVEGNIEAILISNLKFCRRMISLRSWSKFSDMQLCFQHSQLSNMLILWNIHFCFYGQRLYHTFCTWNLQEMTIQWPSHCHFIVKLWT